MSHKEHMPIDLKGHVFVTGGLEIGVRIQGVGTSAVPVLSEKQLVSYAVRILSHPNTEASFPSQYVPLYRKAGKHCRQKLDEAKVSLETKNTPAVPIDFRRLVETGFSFGRVELRRVEEGWSIIIEDDAPFSWAEAVNLAAHIVRDDWMSSVYSNAYVPYLPVYPSEMWTKAGTLIKGAALDLPYRATSNGNSVDAASLEDEYRKIIDQQNFLEQYGILLQKKDDELLSWEKDLRSLEIELQFRGNALSQKEKRLNELEAKLNEENSKAKTWSTTSMSPKKMKRLEHMDNVAGRRDINRGEARRFLRERRKMDKKNKKDNDSTGTDGKSDSK